MDYIDLSYKPGKKDLICEFYITPSSGKELKEAINDVSGESSIGTWTDLSTMKPRIVKELKPTAFEINGNYVKIAYPEALFEPGNMPCILSSVAGNIFGMKTVSALRMTDVFFPEKIIDSFMGPKFGIAGVRKIAGVSKRPLVGTIVKPKLGLNYEEHAQVAYESWSGGLDVVKDDENLTSQDFNPFEKRVTETLKMLAKAENETGEKKIYMPNVTAESNEMLRRAKFVEKSGGTHIMVDVVTCGFSGIQTLREADFNLAIHAHRAMHAALTRSKDFGVSMKVLAKTYRLIGVDQLHIGTAHVGKMEGSAKEVLDIENSLIEKMSDLKNVFPVASGGLHPGSIPPLIERMGANIIAQFGGGVHGHPKGTKAGAAAVRQAAEGTMQGITLEEYAETHRELAEALKKWGDKK